MEISQQVSFDDAVTIAESIVAAYTRDQHKLPGGGFRPGVENVIGLVARRIVANPSGVAMRETVGPYVRYVESGFQGFTLAEQAVLNRYRKRAI